MTATSSGTVAAHAGDRSEYLVSVRWLCKHFPIKEGVLQRVTGHVKAVDGVSFDIRRGETIGLVGESGCGKTTLGRCVSGLTPPTAGGVYVGLGADAHRELDDLLTAGADSADDSRLDDLERRHRIDKMAREHWRVYRRNCQVVFQNAFSSLNPRQLVKDIVGRPLKIHREASGAELIEQVVSLLEQVGLGRQHLYRYPHQFSGGQQQRISIARALALEPDFIVLDEPTSALDVSVQAQILNLLHELQREHGLTYLFISHDLNVVRHMSDRIMVMYLGRVVEAGTADELFETPLHPYTEALLAANPTPTDGLGTQRHALEGAIPDPARPPQGCRFHTRCPVATAWCGWEIDDVIRQVGEDSAPFANLTGVQRHSPFAAEFSFDSEEAAAGLVRELRGGGCLQAMSDALENAGQHGTTVTVRFREVEPVALEEVEPGHVTSCVLHTSREPR
ncbi:MAG: ABC transporter ATP-binding protein [Egibacteraceae bacterium]